MRASIGAGLDLVFIDLEVGVNILDIVVVFEHLEKLQALLGFFALEMHDIARLHDYAGLDDFDLGLLQRLLQSVELLRRAGDLELIALSLDVLAAGLEHQLHQGILGGGIALAWGERLIAPAREAVAESAFRIQAGRAKVVQAQLGDDVGLIGTVPLVVSALPELAR